jgi:hypothetical protein
MAMALAHGTGGRIGHPAQSILKRDRMPTLAEIHLGHLPGHVLFALARNESASREWRKAAVELLLDGNHKEASNPYIFELVMQIKAERQAKTEVQAVVESAVEAEVFEENADAAADSARNPGSAPARATHGRAKVADNLHSNIRSSKANAAPDA